MTGIITGTLELVGSCVSFIVKTSFGIVCLAGVAGTVLYVTKPDEKTFDAYLKNEFKKNNPGIVGKFAGTFVSHTSSTAFTDCIVVRFADVTLVDGSKEKFVGGLGTWRHIKSRNPTMHTQFFPDGSSGTTTTY